MDKNYGFGGLVGIDLVLRGPKDGVDVGGPAARNGSLCKGNTEGAKAVDKSSKANVHFCIV